MTVSPGLRTLRRRPCSPRCRSGAGHWRARRRRAPWPVRGRGSRPGRRPRSHRSSACRAPLRVFVVEPGAERLEHRDRGEVLRRDQLEGVLLTLQLLVEEGGDIGIGRAQRGFGGEITRLDTRTHIDMRAGHCDLCPSVVIAGKTPEKREQRGGADRAVAEHARVGLVQSMIVEASPPRDRRRGRRRPRRRAQRPPRPRLRGRLAKAVGAGRGEGPGAPEEPQSDRVVRDANAERRPLTRDRPAVGAQRAHDRERSGPVRRGQGPSLRAQLHVVLDVGDRRRQEGQLEPVGTALDGVDAADRRRVGRVAREPVDGVGRDRDHAAGPDRRDRGVDAHGISISRTRVRPVRSGTGTWSPGRVSATSAPTTSAWRGSTSSISLAVLT